MGGEKEDVTLLNDRESINMYRKIYMNTYTHIYIYVHICTHIHMYNYNTCRHILTHAHIHILLHTYMQKKEGVGQGDEPLPLALNSATSGVPG